MPSRCSARSSDCNGPSPCTAPVVRNRPAPDRGGGIGANRVRREPYSDETALLFFVGPPFHRTCRRRLRKSGSPRKNRRRNGHRSPFGRSGESGRARKESGRREKKRKDGAGGHGSPIGRKSGFGQRTAAPSPDENFFSERVSTLRRQRADNRHRAHFSAHRRHDLR